MRLLVALLFIPAISPAVAFAATLAPPMLDISRQCEAASGETSRR